MATKAEKEARRLVRERSGGLVKSWDDEKTIPVDLVHGVVLLDDAGSWTAAEVPSDA